MTASVVHVTNRAPGSDNPSMTYSKNHQVMTAGVVHVLNLRPPRSECNPSDGAPHREIIRLHSGEHFGERALLSKVNETRTANCVATTDG
jgi:CRP-like cAMP-binding protein